MLPSLSNMGFGDGGVGMGINMSRMSGLNLGTSMGGRGGDDERRKRLDAVVHLLKSCPSRLSPEGLEILGQRQGLASMLDPAEGPRRDGTRECHLAAPGETIGVEVKFKGNKVVGVDITSLGSSEAVEKHMKSASESLRHNLTLSPYASPMVRSLNKFNRNLERLAKLDKLNSAANSPNFNCFEAIAGVYTSLKRLFDHEKKVALNLIQASKDRREERAEREVMCKKSGKPLMHARENIGLTLDYWMQKRHVFTKQEPQPPDPNHDAMEVDSTSSETSSLASASGHDLYSLNIECEAMAPGEYMPIRLSESWISDVVEKSSEDPDDVFGPVVDWQDPPPTYLNAANNGESNAMSLDNPDVGKLPNIRFVAKLDPPLIVPLQTAINILASTGTSQDTFDGFYHHLLLGTKTVDALAAYPSSEEEIRNVKFTNRPGKDGRNVCEKHLNILHNKTTAIGKVLREIPFSHPKQLIQILPVSYGLSISTESLTTNSKDTPTMGVNRVTA
jgi:Mediator of RNA polymerase II transcription subunit 1